MCVTLPLSFFNDRYDVTKYLHYTVILHFRMESGTPSNDTLAHTAHTHHLLRTILHRQKPASTARPALPALYDYFPSLAVTARPLTFSPISCMEFVRS